MTPAENELRRRYREAYYACFGSLTAIEQIVTEDFPAPEDSDARPSRGDVDMLRALGNELSALLEGYRDKYS